ncbi:MAG: D-amino acid dehydrogenase [Alphaproteobacteria bacterium]|nr:D-amino acid dehydrogenase [Alphaproteobacteria bacterium]
MRVLVLGGGVIGVATAYYLERAGATVTVIDRQAEPAGETSFANAGLIAPTHAYAWASPRAPGTLLRSLWRDDTALRLKPRLDPGLMRWGLRFLAECSAARNRANTLNKLRLCLYSLACLERLRGDEGLAYEQTTKGALYLYRDAGHMAVALENARLLREHGADIDVVDAARCVAIEPALAGIAGRLAGALYAPKDESGDCRLFTKKLAARCAGLGTSFRWGTTVRGFEASGDRVIAAITDLGRVEADAFVLALGSYSPLVARSVGLRLPIHPVKGYSLTFPIVDAARAPTVPGVDEHALVAFSRLGDRLRLTATAEFTGYDTTHRPRDFAVMLRAVRELFPGAADYDRPERWACLRPMTPDGPPIMGRAGKANLWLNTGHGHIGWTMAAGSGRVVADQVMGREPEIDLTGLVPDGRL